MTLPAIHRANLGYLLRHPWQLALALLGIAVGVAVIVAVDLANASARKAFLLSMDAVTGAATHQVIGGPRGLDEAVYRELRVEHGISRIAPIVSGSVQVGDLRLQLLGIDPFAEQAVRGAGQFVEVDAGAADDALDVLRAFLARAGTVTMNARTAAALGVDVGDAFAVSLADREATAELVGIIEADAAGGLDDVLVADIATAQAWLREPGRITRIDVRIADGDDTTLPALQRALPDNAIVLTAPGRTQKTADLSNAFMTNLKAMSLLALLVGLFLIYNSMSFSVLQRRGLIGIQRALGVTRRQVFALVLAEAAVIGTLAASLGVVTGSWLGEFLLELVTRSINDFYYRVTVTGLVLQPLSVAKGMLAGVLVAMLAALVPAFEAASYAPRLAMARSSLEQKTRQWLPIVAAAGIAIMLAAAAVLLLSGRSLVAGLTAVFMLILGFACSVPLAVRMASRFLAALAGRYAGTPARMALAGIGASLSRTGVAIVALAIAVAATIGVSIMVSSFRASVGTWLDQTLQADIYVGAERGSLDAALIRDIEALPAVEALSTSRRAWLETETTRTQLIAIRMAPAAYAGTELLGADPDEVWPAWEAGDVVLVSEPYAYRNEVERGDSIDLRTDAGSRAFRVAGLYKSFDINSSSVLISRQSYDRHWRDDGVDTIGLYLVDAADSAAVIQQIATLGRDRQRLRYNATDSIRELSLEVFDRTFIITDVLYWLALGVACIGMLSAMLALQLERAREFAVLRALGMTPVQVGGTIAVQTGAIGLLSGLAALPLGILMAFVLIEVINRRAFGWTIDMQVSVVTLAASLMLAVLAAVLASIYPAIRAARAEPALAMREE